VAAGFLLLVGRAQPKARYRGFDRLVLGSGFDPDDLA
jgi:hypothetical protein